MIDTPRHQGLRKKLVAALKTKYKFDKKVLEAIGQVPRHVFIDKAFVEIAYEDRAFPIGDGQTISHPSTVAYQTQLLNVYEDDKILEIGTGSGYQTAVLSAMGAKVYSLERIRSLHTRAKRVLNEIACKNVRCLYGDGYEGLPDLAPFDKIIITAAAPEIPEKLLQQLIVGGVIVLPFGEGDQQIMYRITRTGEKDFVQDTYDTFSFVPMLKGKIK
ncbi:MAG: protein-L-isoaspartate(D-aspartate) O-methyltransferase [Chitinophagales bacterium]|nr:protein-L-isoaspartate(D-aspartate) O-methyltransferase [Chitinophagales bacterium]